MNHEKKLINTIERLNLEIINLKNSKEFQTGKQTLKIIDLLKHLHFLTIIKKLIHRRKIAYLYDGATIANEENCNNDVVIIQNNAGPKIVVYTCIVGNYDSISDIYLKESNCDYILFTNNDHFESNGKWEVRKILEVYEKQFDSVSLNRYYKMNPFAIFQNDDYDYAIYLDGNISIVSVLSDFVSQVDSSYGLALHLHKNRDCLFEEAKACQLLGKGNPSQIEKQINKYFDDKMPKNYGLLECTCIVTDLKNPIAEEILTEWWQEFTVSDSKRDQLSLPYVLWKKGISVSSIGTLGKNIFTNSKLRSVDHIEK